MSTEKQWIYRLEETAAQPFSGWDFSPMKNHYREQPLSWDYRKKVADFLKPDTRLLDMGTGGGEFLLSLGHSPALTSVTEGWEPNYNLCKKRLEPMGMQVAYCDAGSQPLPFDSGSFDLVLNRHEDFDLQEVSRVLAPGGFFITQQVGGSNNLALRRLLTPWAEPGMADFNLENQLPAFAAAGFRIMYKNQCYTRDAFTDAGALCWYAVRLPWEFPGFSVKASIQGLKAVQQTIDARGCYETTVHRFILIGKKRK